MITRQKLVTYGIPTLAAATIVVAAGLAGRTSTPSTDARPPTQEPVPVAEGDSSHQIDVVFAVDTTGSMGGLIDGAKRTVWSIASHIRSLDKQADVHIGLVAFRDIGDDYVTRDYPLSGDLDQMFVNLSSFRADGGGDTPEDVDAALYDAIHKMQWRPGAKKLVFLVGDAPPASRGEVPPYDVLAKQAAERQITINTIRAGFDNETQQKFEKIAMLGGGEFSSIQQDGGVKQIATPYDDKMAELSAKIDSTAVIVGGDAIREGYAAKMASGAAAAAPAKADRAYYYNGKGEAPRDDADIVGTGKAIEALPPTALPAELRGMSKDELNQEVARRAETRKTAQKEIDTLAKQRNEYLEKNSVGDGGFDAKVKKSVEKAMKKK